LLATFVKKYTADLYAEEPEARTVAEPIVPCPSVACYSCGEMTTNTASYCVRCDSQLRQLYYVTSLSLFIASAIFILSGISFLGPLGVTILEITIALLFLRVTYSGYLLLKMIGILS
jgi:hypothetical protein